ncbi:MAG: ABC transporter permease [Deltaproteobacteria bacterium]|nr:ABC transporter permease [Deltaproteobacteria bacterium]MBW2016046.1 ABC transporter permease [Deltaproteobacteria bacterium]MBW2128343.1 ABC transporter permease [Deltaproteobacteria bacterium]MBW2302143.1 ABC transporter permease [Deltaproteobacteria bacterium]
MNDLNVAVILGSIVAGAAPIVLASLGETISEKAGVINLSLDGSILLSAMVAFVTAFETKNLLLGFAGGAAAGAVIAGVVGLFSIYLGQSQVAVGFVLTLTARDLAYFFGNPYARQYGPQVIPWPIPGLHEIPLVGQAFFNHGWIVYASMLMIFLCWWYFYRTPQGLRLRMVGEHPEAAYARGTDSRAVQMTYTVIGGLLVGLAGAAFSLCVKPGWGRPQGAEGTGWIALAIVIFGGWHPVKVALGAYLFSFLQVMGIQFQRWWPSIPAQVFQVAPFPLMIFTLLLLSAAQRRSGADLDGAPSILARIVGVLGGAPPRALGKTFSPE